MFGTNWEEQFFLKELCTLRVTCSKLWHTTVNYYGTELKSECSLICSPPSYSDFTCNSLYTSLESSKCSQFCLQFCWEWEYVAIFKLLPDLASLICHLDIQESITALYWLVRTLNSETQPKKNFYLSTSHSLTPHFLCIKI